MTGEDWVTKDFYGVLGVPKDADAVAIKKAYRKLARKYHPDQNPNNPRAEEQFKRIGEAYAVLKDDASRKRYDAIRSMGGMGGGVPFASGPAGGGIHFEDVFGSMYGGGPAQGGSGNARVRFGSGDWGGFEDVLSGLFGDAAGRAFGSGPAASGPQPRRGADLAASTQLSFRQAVEGTTLKVVVEGRQMTVRVPAGVSEGKKLRLAGRGRPGAAGGSAGDLVVTVHVTPHPVFTLKGKQDLQMTLPITVDEAVSGAVVQVPLLDGETTQIKVPAGTSSGTILRLRGHGAKPTGARRAGDLLARVQIMVPARPGRSAKQAAQQFAAASGEFDPRADLAHKVTS